MAESTKERIIRAAFSFYTVPNFQDVSLSQIAGKVGITKAAIFRHFASKEALQRAMTDAIYADISAILLDIQNASRTNRMEQAMEALICFLAAHQEYMGYFLSLDPEHGEQDLLRATRANGITLLDDMYDAGGHIKNSRRYFENIAFIATIFVFILHYKKAAEFHAGQVPGIKDFAAKLMSLINSGIGDDTASLTPPRLRALNRLCAENVQGLPPEDRVFTALADVVKEHGFQGATVERIAQQLDMAKSSLYSWFANKGELIRSSIFTEIQSMSEIVLHGLSAAATPAERVYILLRANGEYFSRHPSVITVCRWLNFADGPFSSPEKDAEGLSVLHALGDRLVEKPLATALPDLGTAMMNEHVLLGWLFSLPLILQMHGSMHGLGSRDILKNTKSLLLIVEHGLEHGDKKHGSAQADNGGEQDE